MEIERDLLRRDTDFAADIAVSTRIRAKHAHRAFVECERPNRRLSKGGFTGAIASDQRVDLAFF
jgi:hypothetical protein